MIITSQPNAPRTMDPQPVPNPNALRNQGGTIEGYAWNIQTCGEMAVPDTSLDHDATGTYS